MKSLFLFPYCLLPVNTGAKVEAWKTLSILKSLGECTVLSASTKPVGAGWSHKERHELEQLGYSLVLREDVQNQRNIQQLFGILFASMCKIIGFERAFGHRNPYHRYAFPSKLWYSMTHQYDIAVINYSYWARLPTACPKIIILHDLLSNTMLTGLSGEVSELKTADLVVVISCEEEPKLHKQGIRHTLWSPPAVQRMDADLTKNVGVIGSANRFNREGLRWLSSSGLSPELPIQVFGDICHFAKQESFELKGRYEDAMVPYRQCGIILIPTSQGTGVQIKTIEALAAGRAIVARRGGLRGIPHSSEAWIEVDSPDEMLEVATRLSRNIAERERLGRAAHSYYEKNLNATKIKNQLKTAIQTIYSAKEICTPLQSASA